MADTAKSQDALVGSLIAGRFRVERRIAAGGMGVVYAGVQEPLDRPVALKIMEPRQGDADDARFGERFLLEAAAVARLQHPNTIVLYDYGETADGRFFHAMEYVDGLDLRRVVQRRGPLSAAQAIHVGMQVAGSLREAHRAGMIHRDLKPPNLMVTERHDDPWFVKVLDFGLVKVLGEGPGPELTQSGMLLGSPRYMAPEQVLGGVLDHRVDIYALGAVLYFALAGRPPFTDASKFEVMRAQVDEDPEPFATAAPAAAVPPALEAVVRRCLAKDPDHRYPSLDALGSELAACARALGLEEPSLSGSTREFESGIEARPAKVASAPREPAPGPSAAAFVGAPAEPASSTRAEPPAGGDALRYLLVAMVAGLAVLGGIAATLALWTPDAAPPATARAPRAEPAPSAPADDAPSTPSRSLRVESEPPGARVRRGEADLGDAPFTLVIPGGEQWELTFHLPGHETRTVSVGAGRDRLMVHLAPLTAPGAPGQDADDETDAPGENADEEAGDAADDLSVDRAANAGGARPSGRGSRPLASRPSASPPSGSSRAGPSRAAQPIAPSPRPLGAPRPSPSPSAPAPRRQPSDLRHPWAR